MLSLTVLTGPRRGEPPRHQPVRARVRVCMVELVYKSRGVLCAVSRAREVVNYVHVPVFAK